MGSILNLVPLQIVSSMSYQGKFLVTLAPELLIRDPNLHPDFHKAATPIRNVSTTSISGLHSPLPHQCAYIWYIIYSQLGAGLIFSRLLGPHAWLLIVCATRMVNFIDQFNLLETESCLRLY